MNRYEYALTAAQAPQQEPLLAIAQNFNDAVSQVIAEGQDPHQDPAVIVLGSFIAFHVHADLNTLHGYQQLLSLCEDQVVHSPELQ